MQYTRYIQINMTHKKVLEQVCEGDGQQIIKAGKTTKMTKTTQGHPPKRCGRNAIPPYQKKHD